MYFSVFIYRTTFSSQNIFSFIKQVDSVTQRGIPLASHILPSSQNANKFKLYINFCFNHILKWIEYFIKLQIKETQSTTVV